ncbi:MAG: BRO family protein [Cetobacterium sp.]|uniref:BRO family protein n=1 Tax=Cetobacterium sp. TaxID=2071632 RepID=UPI003EE462E0
MFVMKSEKVNILGMELTVFNDNLNPIFLAKEIADILEIENVSDMISRLDETERSRLKLGRQGEMNALTEFGVYEILMTSRKRVAKEFRKGFKEFLKSYRLGAVKVVKKAEEEIMVKDSIKNLETRLKAIESILETTKLDRSEKHILKKAIDCKIYSRKDYLGLKDCRKLYANFYRDFKNKFNFHVIDDLEKNELDPALNFIKNWIEDRNLTR